MIDKYKLMELLKKLEPFNNTDIPAWVLSIIEHMPESEDIENGN